MSQTDEDTNDFCDSVSIYWQW